MGRIRFPIDWKMFIMAEMHCPYCYGRNISKIIYTKKGINKRKKQNYNLSDNEIIMPKNRLKKIDFDAY